MKLLNNETNNVFVLPKKILKYINNAKKSELKLILYIFSNSSENFDIQKASQVLGESPESISSGLAFWRGTGLISELEDRADELSVPEKNKSAKLPEVTDEQTTKEKDGPQAYSTVQVSDALNNDEEFKQLVNYAEHTIGELLNPSKVASLLYLYDNLGMQCDVIMGIIAHCVSIEKAKISYIEKTARGMHNDGVVTYRDLEQYLAQKKKYAQYESMVKRIIGADNRSLTASEKKMVAVWESRYGYDEEVLKVAYEKTINAINKPSVSYMSKILESWYNNNAKTLDDIMNLTEKRNTQTKATLADKKTGFDISLEDIFERP